MGTRPSGASRPARTCSCSAFPTASARAGLRAPGSSASTPVATHEALGNQAKDRAAGPLQVALEGHAVVTRKGSTEVYRYELPVPQTYLAPPPLVADLGGSRTIVVRDSSGKLLLVPPDGGAARVQIANTFEHFQTHVDPAGSGPTICDMDGDGDNEIVTTLSDADGTSYCAVLDGSGKLERRIDLEPGTRLLNRGPTGSLGPGRGRWIILRMFYGEGAYQGRRPLVVAFDGKTGAKLWMRDHYASYGPNPVIFAAHLPTAVHDLDGDGADDWLVCSENFYGVISVKDNRDLVGPVVLSERAARPLDGLQLSFSGKGPTEWRSSDCFTTIPMRWL